MEFPTDDVESSDVLFEKKSKEDEYESEYQGEEDEGQDEANLLEGFPEPLDMGLVKEPSVMDNTLGVTANTLGVTTGKDGCPSGYMVIEGSCVSKKKLSKDLDVQKEEIKQRAETLKNPEGFADLQQELLQQQIKQADKAEDDLDEIIEELQKQRRMKNSKL